MKALGIIFVVVLLATLAAVPTASPSSALTKDRAFRTAKTCLMNNGARFVGRRGDGGGFVFFRGWSRISFWKYDTTLGLVSSATYYANGLPASKRKILVRCISKGI